METIKKQNPNDRYQRQILLSEVGSWGQNRLKESKILLIGAGGLGSPAAFYLAAAGVGCIGIVDDDIVEKHNLNRQILHSPGFIGKSKVDSAKETLETFNPDISIKPYALRFSSEKQLENLIQEYDLVLDCSDNYETRYAINQACINQQKPWIYAAVSEFEGQVMTIIPQKTACYRCLYPAAPKKSGKSAKTAAVMGVAPGCIGTLQAMEALKYLLNKGKLLIDRLLFVDLMETHFDVMTVTKNKTCPACRQDLP